MKKFFTLILTLLAVAQVSNLQAQDPQFSQFYANQVLLNPAFAGAANGPRLALNYRAQWVSIPNAYRTFATSFDMPLNFGDTRHGVGGTVMVDQAGAGDLRQTNVLGNYAYRLMINDNHAIRLGLAAGVRMFSLDMLKLRFPDELLTQTPRSPDVIGSGVRDRRTEFEATFGALYYSKRVWAGTTIRHLTGAKQWFINKNTPTPDVNLPMHISMYAGFQIPLDRERTGRYAISPAIMYRNQRPFQQIDLGTYLTLDPIVIGMWYRLNDALIGLVGLRKGMFAIGYSYDYTISSLTNTVSGGSHEVSLVVEFEGKQKQRKPKVNMSCPVF